MAFPGDGQAPRGFYTTSSSADLGRTASASVGAAAWVSRPLPFPPARALSHASLCAADLVRARCLEVLSLSDYASLLLFIRRCVWEVV
jgi:hypothetical protein